MFTMLFNLFKKSKPEVKAVSTDSVQTGKTITITLNGKKDYDCILSKDVTPEEFAYFFTRFATKISPNQVLKQLEQNGHTDVKERMKNSIMMFSREMLMEYGMDAESADYLFERAAQPKDKDDGGMEHFNTPNNGGMY